MKRIKYNVLLVFSAVIVNLALLSTCYAQPYGVGTYDANVPYGSQTSLTISASNVSISLSPTSSGVLASTTGNVTVASTDVKGFKLYVRSLTTTNMNNLGTLLPTSANGSPAALAVDTWGYNLDASTNFVGMTLSDVLIKSITTPATSGDTTPVTYGVKLDLAKPAGSYSTSVIYTAVPQTT